MRNSVTGDGGALYLERTSSNIANSVFQGNSAAGLGGAISTRGAAADCQWSNNNVSTNSASDGWAVFWDSTAQLNINGGNFLENYNTSSAGAVVRLADQTVTWVVEDLLVRDWPGLTTPQQGRVTSAQSASRVNCICNLNDCGGTLCDLCSPSGVCPGPPDCGSTCSGNGTSCLDGSSCGCLPSCFRRTCGPDGCGGQCGDCQIQGQSNMTNVTCVDGQCACDNCPTTFQAECGFNLCGRACGGINGRCPTGQCNNFKCNCTANCNFGRCADGCGGFCTPCKTDEVCSLTGFCVRKPACTPRCAQLSCDEPDYCGGFCACSTGVCRNKTCCLPVCTGLLCGPDSCGGECGSCAGFQACNVANGTCFEIPGTNFTFNTTANDSWFGSSGTMSTILTYLSSSSPGTGPGTGSGSLQGTSDPNCVPDCADAECDADDGCGGVCECDSGSDVTPIFQSTAFIAGVAAGAAALLLLIGLIILICCCRKHKDTGVQIEITETYPQPDDEDESGSTSDQGPSIHGSQSHLVASQTMTETYDFDQTNSASLHVYNRISLAAPSRAPLPEPVQASEPGLMIYHSVRLEDPPKATKAKSQAHRDRT